MMGMMNWRKKLDAKRKDSWVSRVYEQMRTENLAQPVRGYPTWQQQAHTGQEQAESMVQADGGNWQFPEAISFKFLSYKRRQESWYAKEKLKVWEMWGKWDSHQHAWSSNIIWLTGRVKLRTSSQRRCILQPHVAALVYAKWVSSRPEPVGKSQVMSHQTDSEALASFPSPSALQLDSSFTEAPALLHRGARRPGYPLPTGLPSVSLLVFMPCVIKFSHEWSYAS